MTSAIPCGLSFSLFFSWTGCVVSHLISLTHRSPRYPLRNLCSFVTLAMPPLVFDGMDTAFCQALISLELAELRILHAKPPESVPGHLLSHSALSSYGLFASLALCFATTSGSSPEKLPGFKGSTVFRHAPIPRNELGITKTTTP